MNILFDNGSIENALNLGLFFNICQTFQALDNFDTLNIENFDSNNNYLNAKSEKITFTNCATLHPRQARAKVINLRYLTLETISGRGHKLIWAERQARLL